MSGAFLFEHFVNVCLPKQTEFTKKPLKPIKPIKKS